MMAYIWGKIYNMKRLLLLLSVAFCFKSFAQSDSTLPKIVDDTLFTTCGYNIIEKGEIKIGLGTVDDGTFKYIRINSASLFAYTSSTNNSANHANSLDRRSSGLKYKVKSVGS